MLDIRLPIGLYFSLTGVLLALWGLVADPANNARSLGLNLNLWWGLALIAFGAVMLGLTFLARRRAEGGTASPQQGEGPGTKGLRLEA